MKVLVLPRDPNPYQRLLYGEMQHHGVQISYLGELTPSRTLNLLLLPLEVTARRIAGAQLVHLHWVFGFALPGGQRFPAVRHLAYAWFLVWLRTCRLLGVHLVWTVHNVLPHAPVFADDVSARRALVDACDLVLAHSPSALADLAEFGAITRRSAVIPHGPIVLSPPGCVHTPGTGDGPRRFVFFGRVLDYKGVDDLLSAFAALPDDIAAHLTVAGQCDDPRLRACLVSLARTGGERVSLRLEHLPDPELAQLVASADVVVLPFRQVTTSGSATLALCHGRPLILPDLPGLAGLPDRAILRYRGGTPALTAAMARLARADSELLVTMSAAARDYASGPTWPEIAQKTVTEMRAVLGRVPEADSLGQELTTP